jgi:hypothetical protein
MKGLLETSYLVWKSQEWWMAFTSVADPHSHFAGPNPGENLNADPDEDLDPGPESDP